MRFELKSLGIWSVVKVTFFLNLIGGFIGGLLYAPFLALIFAAGDLMPYEQFGGPPMDTTDISVGALFIILPLMGAFFAAVFGTIMYTIIALIYNLIAKLVGGLELNLQTVAGEAPQPQAHYATAGRYQQPAPRTTAAPPPPPPSQAQPQSPPPPPPPEEQPPSSATAPKPEEQPPSSQATPAPEEKPAPPAKPPVEPPTHIPDVTEKQEPRDDHDTDRDKPRE